MIKFISKYCETHILSTYRTTSRRSQEELDRLKLHREQQNILLQQQRETAELGQKYKKIAEGHRIANQVLLIETEYDTCKPN